MIIIRKQTLNSPDTLTGIARQVIDLIPGGASWLKWAIAVPKPTFPFKNEAQLVSGIQEGLSGGRLLLLNKLGLLLEPTLLLTFAESDLQPLYDLEKGQPPNSVLTLGIQQVLSAHRLLTQDDLKVVGTFLQQTGVANNPVFQAMPLGDTIALFRILHAVPGEWAFSLQVQKEAAVYAANHAANPLTFANIYRFYMLVYAWPRDRFRNVPKVADRVREQLGLVLRAYLQNPALPAPAEPAAIEDALQLWLSRGRVLGFESVSRGVAELTAYAPDMVNQGKELETGVPQYLLDATQLLIQEPLSPLNLSQDGSTYLYEAKSPKGDLSVLAQDAATGMLSLFSYQPVPVKQENPDPAVAEVL